MGHLVGNGCDGTAAPRRDGCAGNLFGRPEDMPITARSEEWRSSPETTIDPARACVHQAFRGPTEEAGGERPAFPSRRTRGKAYDRAMLTARPRPVVSALPRLAAALLLLAPATPGRADEAYSDPAAAESVDGPWPRTYQEDGFDFAVYQPQVEKWEGDRITSRFAVAVNRTGQEETFYGVIWVQARTDVEKEQGRVHLSEIKVVRSSFPSAPKGTNWGEVLDRKLPDDADVSLERLQSSLAIRAAEKRQKAVPVKNDPPAILFRTAPALLVYIDGEPALRPVPGTGLTRIVNTRPLVLSAAGRFYLHLFDGWMEAGALGGPWAVSRVPPPELSAALEASRRAGDADLLEPEPPQPGQGEPAAAPPSLAQGPVPEIIVANRPTELIVTEGPPQLAAIAGAGLLYWKNTGSTVVVDQASGSLYVLLAGRWFRSRTTAGPWQFVPGKSLPRGFARVPEGHEKASLLTAVPGTPQAREAVIANSIPQTAVVNRAEARIEPTFDGEPQLAPIEGTPLSYVVNSATPIIRVDAQSWYAVVNGVWFVATGPRGPWVVADRVPAVIYTIPPSSPLHYVTYVKIYGADTEAVRVGYTPGYLGTVVSPEYVVVYGTGWWYQPWIGTYWYGPPLTYGFGWNVYWSPWDGWTVGFGWDWPWPWYAGCVRPWWGPMPWAYRPWGWGYRPVSHGNVYGGYWGHAVRPAPPRAGWRLAPPGIAPRPAPGARPAPRPEVRPAPAPGVRPAPGPAIRPAPSPVPPGRRSDIYAGQDGRVYRPTPQGGWEQNRRGTWQPAPRPAGPGPQLDRERAARQRGDQRAMPRPSVPQPRPAAPPSRPAPPRGRH